MTGSCHTQSFEIASNSLFQIRKMIADNYFLLTTYVVLFIGISIVLYYFGKHLFTLILEYNRMKADEEKTHLSSNSNNVNMKEADNNIYDQEVDLPPDNPQAYMDLPKRSFVKDLDKTFKDYNEKVGDFMQSIGKENDNKIDSEVLFSRHDNYNYDENDK